MGTRKIKNKKRIALCSIVGSGLIILIGCGSLYSTQKHSLSQNISRESFIDSLTNLNYTESLVVKSSSNVYGEELDVKQESEIHKSVDLLNNNNSHSFQKYYINAYDKTVNGQMESYMVDGVEYRTYDGKNYYSYNHNQDNSFNKELSLINIIKQFYSNESKVNSLNLNGNYLNLILDSNEMLGLTAFNNFIDTTPVTLSISMNYKDYNKYGIDKLPYKLSLDVLDTGGVIQKIMSNSDDGYNMDDTSKISIQANYTINDITYNKKSDIVEIPDSINIQNVNKDEIVNNGIDIDLKVIHSERVK